ncbi:STAS domain-containing protein [Pseudonocardia pini]|uniref:STAS domain-containing protein n=1 Tax=Pseudonocardia pini TaxID=2758030 RepID=UPI0015F031A4|nr:STAS domain-containing protein [Pseudonocardia pini]
MTEHPTPEFDGTGLAPLHLAATRVRDGVVVVAVRGELDSATAPQVTRYLQQATSPEVGVVALDLSGVTFLASSGIQMLVSALREDQGVDGALHLVAPSPAVERVLRILGMDEMFTSHATTQDLLRVVLAPHTTRDP